MLSLNNSLFAIFSFKISSICSFVKYFPAIYSSNPVFKLYISSSFILRSESTSLLFTCSLIKSSLISYCINSEISDFILSINPAFWNCFFHALSSTLFAILLSISALSSSSKTSGFSISSSSNIL